MDCNYLSGDTKLLDADESKNFFPPSTDLAELKFPDVSKSECLSRSSGQDLRQKYVDDADNAGIE